MDVPKKVTKVEIGTASDVNVDLTAIAYAGDRPMGSGPGGDHLSPLVVPNTVAPIGIVGHHKWWEIVVALEEDEYTAFYNTNVSGTDKAIVMTDDNTAIGYFAITQMNEAGETRTISYETAKTYVAGVAPNKIQVEEGKYAVEVKLVCIGTRTVPAWA